jgi:hypothetical protein
MLGCRRARTRSGCARASGGRTRWRRCADPRACRGRAEERGAQHGGRVRGEGREGCIGGEGGAEVIWWREDDRRYEQRERREERVLEGRGC